MVNTCIVSGCKRESYPGSGITFHRIPANAVQRALWFKSMNLDSSNVPKFACVCSNHFLDHDYLTEARKKLKPQAVPSILTQVPSEDDKNEVPIIKEEIPDDVAEAGCLSGQCDSPYKAVLLEDSSTQTEEIIQKPTRAKLRRDVKVLKQRLKRRDTKIANLRSILRIIKKRCDIYRELLKHPF